MLKPKYVYLAGPITGLAYGECTDWREYASRAFPSFIEGVSPMRAKNYLQSAGSLSALTNDYGHPLSRHKAIFSRDKHDVVTSDAVFCNLLGAKTPSIGTIMELAWAQDHGKLIVVAIEPEGNLHEHCMLSETFQFRYHSLDEAIEGLVQVLAPHEKYMHTNIAQLRMAREANKLDLSTPALKAHA